MNVRIAQSLAAAALVLPLLSGCGGSTEAAPSASTAPTTSAAPARAPGSPEPTVDAAADEKAVVTTSERFVKAGLTIGYPDKDVDEYADRVKPFMTADGFDALFGGKSRASAAAAVEKLSGDRARTAPKIVSTEVDALTVERARTKVTLRHVAQVRDGDGWRTLTTSAKDSTTLRLVKQDGTWLVDDAS